MSTITVKEYAKKVGKTKEAIFYQIKKGKIKAQKKLCQWVGNTLRRERKT